MPKRSWVKARSGIAVPTEDFARTHRTIAGESPVEVALTTYYLRRLAEGDLVEVAAPPAATPANKTEVA